MLSVEIRGSQSDSDHRFHKGTGDYDYEQDYDYEVKVCCKSLRCSEGSVGAGFSLDGSGDPRLATDV